MGMDRLGCSSFRGTAVRAAFMSGAGARIAGAILYIGLSAGPADACSGKITTTERALLGVAVDVELFLTSRERSCGGSIIRADSGPTIDTQPKHGTATYDGTYLVYTPTPGYIGQDQFLAGGSQNGKRLTITVYVSITN
jgi:hypothetical protein